MKVGHTESRALGTVVALATALSAGPAMAGAKIAVDDTHWVSVGAGLRASFNAVEDGAPSGEDYSKNFAINNMRLYVAGQVHEKVKLTFNTEIAGGVCTNGCGDNSEIIVLDAIAQFELMPAFNIWAGRMLVPADRIEMNGPYYSLTWDQYTVPLFPSDQLDNDAGKYGRDNGITFWGTAHKFQYAVGIFDGYNGGSNSEDKLLYSTRLAYNFLNMEQNPGYYTSSTSYGGLGKIFTLGLVLQAQRDGAGTEAEPEDFSAWVLDFLYENPFASGNVLTIEGEYKSFNADISDAARAGLDGPCFCLFDGSSWFGTVAWLFPQEVGIGKFQPYIRYTNNDPSDYAKSSDLTELGLNYVIKGHDAYVNLNFTRGDAWLTGEPRDEDRTTMTVGVQVQI